MLIWAITTCLVLLCSCLILRHGIVQVRDLGTIELLPSEKTPVKVSIIVAACNEEKEIQAGLQSLLDQDYLDLEIIVINDRSTDATGAIIEALGKNNSRLQILHIDTLPQGWLGKNHALYQGAKRATGAYLVFTDADIVMEPSVIGRSVVSMEAGKLDHLCLIFKNVTSGGFLNATIADALSGLFLLLRPWKVNQQNSKYFMGVGGFNMVRKSAYQAIGGHKTFPLHPIDDVMLGKKVKEAGFRQDCLNGCDFIQIRWYEDLQGLIEGLMKNAYCFYNFNPLLLAIACLAILSLTILPPWMLIFGTVEIQVMCFLAMLLRTWSGWLSSKAMGVSAKHLLWFQLSPYVILYILIKAACLTHIKGGITWRGTFYPLHLLKQNEPILTLSWFLGLPPKR